jgi:sterol desaturase/sphingolipid hydroxylase (fatty acid hydroxylase superfamily)
LPTTELAVTATIAYASAGLWYEWVHFIVHTRVKFPKNSYFDTCKTHHARHHLVSSDHWLAFSYPAVDDWLGTNPSFVQALRKTKPARLE